MSWSKRALGLILLLSLQSTVALANPWQDIKDFFKEAIQENDLKVKLISKKKDFGNGFGLGVRGDIIIEPSYIDNKSIQTNRWRINLNSNGAELFGFNPDHKAFLNGGMRAEVEMSEFFDDNNDALRDGLNLVKNDELWWWNFPYNTGNARKMNDNASAIFSANFNVGLGFANKNMTETLNSFVNLSATLGNWGGSYKFYIYKYPEGSCFYEKQPNESEACKNSDRVRLILVGLRTHTKWSAKADLEYMDILNLTRSSYLNKQLSRAMGIDELIMYQLGASNKDLFVADYVLDLKNEKVAKAFDAFMDQEFKWSSWLRFQTLRITNPFVDFEEIREYLVETVKPLDDLAAEMDQGYEDQPVHERPAFRRDAASDQASDKFKDCGLNLLVYSYECNSRTTNSHIVYVGPDGVENNLNNARKSKKTEHRLLDLLNLKRVKEITREQVGVVLKEDEYFRPVELLYLSSGYIFNDDRFSAKRNLKGTRKDVLRVIPVDLHPILEQDPNWQKWYAHKQKKTKASINLQVYLNEEALKYFPQKSAGEFADSLDLFLDKADRDDFAPDSFPTVWRLGRRAEPLAIDRSNRDSNSRSSRYRKDVEIIAEQLEKVANRSLSAEKRRDAFFSLEKNSLFMEIGMSFLVSLVFDNVPQGPGYQDLLEQLVHVKLHMTSKKFRDQNAVDWTFGNPTYVEQQKLLNSYQALLYDNKYILRDPETLD